MKRSIFCLALIFNLISQTYASDPMAPLHHTLSLIDKVTADVSILVLDLRYQKGSIKVCELGQGMESRYKGYDAMFGKGVMWNKFWDDFAQFKIPMWYVGPMRYQEQDKKEIVCSRFPELNVTWVEDLEEVLASKAFKQIYRSQEFNPNLISGHKGLVMFMHRNSADWDIQRFRRYNPGFLILENVLGPFVNNKYYTNLVFNDPELQQFKPRSVLCEKKYRKDLARDVMQHLPADRYVIKPLSQFKGRGVIIVDKKDLANSLEKVITAKNLPIANKKLEQKFNYHDETYSYWTRDASTHFLVEEYCPSKTIEVDGKPYDATMRVVCLLHYDKTGSSVKYCDAFWKLPVRSLEDTAGTATEKYKSLGIVPTAVSEEDKKDVYAICDKFVLKMYRNMIKIINREPVPCLTPPIL